MVMLAHAMRWARKVQCLSTKVARGRDLVGSKLSVSGSRNPAEAHIAQHGRSQHGERGRGRTDLKTSLAGVALLLLASIGADLASGRLATGRFSFTSSHSSGLSRRDAVG